MARPDQCLDMSVKRRAIPEVVSLPAEIDITNAPAVGRDLMVALRLGVSVVIADMSSTTYCDSSALSQLIIANKHAVCTGAELRVVTSSPAVRRIMQVIGADQILRLYPDIAAALTAAPQTEEQRQDRSVS